MTDSNGWNEHKLAVYTRLDSIDETNKTQTKALEVIGESIGDMRGELKVFKTNIRWTVTIVTIIMSSIIGMAIRLIAR